MHTRSLCLSMFLSAGVLLGASSARAEGLLLQQSKTMHPTRSAIQVDIQEQVATTVAELEFAATAAGAGRFVFPVPEGASVVGFSVLRSGQWQEAKVSSKDPAPAASSGGGGSAPGELDEYVGEGGFVIDIPGLSGGELKVRVELIQLLPYEFGQVTYSYPLQRAPWASQQATETHVALRLASERTIVGYDAPGGQGNEVVLAQSANLLEVSYGLGVSAPSGPFRFRYGLEQASDLYVNLLTHHESCGEDGFFMLVVEPRSEVDEGEILPKYFSFVMDTSGSMAGTKLAQAKQGALVGIDALNGSDLFNVLAYSSGVTPLFPGPTAVSEGSRTQAKQFINKQLADGGTNIHDSLLQALSAPTEGDLARIIVLLTDGQPTASVTDPSQIVQAVKAANGGSSRIFTFGVGADVNKLLLTNLATSNGGEARFVGAKDDIGEALGLFFKRVSRPVLTDVKLSLGFLSTSDIFPAGPRDLFAGTQHLILGRYKGGGASDAVLVGSMLGAPQSYPFQLDFPQCAQQNGFLPRLWAKAKIDALLAKIAESGKEDPSLVAEIEALGTKYGIQTPYTSFGVSAPPPVDSSPGASSSTSPGSGSGWSPGSSNPSPSSYKGGALEDGDGGCQVSAPGAGGAGGVGLLLLGLTAAARRRRAPGGRGVTRP